MKSIRIALTLAVCAFVSIGLAWDVEHDEIAQLTGEFMPKAVAETFTFDDFAILMANCHFPDMTEYPMENGKRRFHTLTELAQRVGDADAALLKSAGYDHGYYFHRPRGKAALMGMLARAFASGAHAHAAFYISALTHSVSDESALNHPPLLGFFRYSNLKDIDFTMRKIEEGAKNVFGFRSDGHVCQLVRESLADFKPEAPKGNFPDAVMALVVDTMVRQSAISGVLEGKIAFAPLPEAERAIADLIAMQIRTLETIVWTCWTLRAKNAALPNDDFDRAFDRQVALAVKTVDPRPQAVFAGIFDETLNPKSPKATVGLVCEAYTRAGAKLSFPGRILTAASGRTLRAHGYAVKGLDFQELIRNGFPDPATVPCVLVCIGGTGYMSNGPDADFADAIRAYRDRGGRLIIVGGEDRHDITGFSSKMRLRRDRDVPATAAWHVSNVGDVLKMALIAGKAMPRLNGARYPLRRDPNFDGFCKPVCRMETPDGETLLELDNGQARFPVAVLCGRVVWLPEYALMPYLFVPEDPKLPLDALTLDAFGTKVLLDVMDATSKE